MTCPLPDRLVALLAGRAFLAMCLLVSGCALSMGVTNSPPSPNECTVGARSPGCP